MGHMVRQQPPVLTLYHHFTSCCFYDLVTGHFLHHLSGFPNIQLNTASHAPACRSCHCLWLNTRQRRGGTVLPVRTRTSKVRRRVEPVTMCLASEHVGKDFWNSSFEIFCLSSSGADGCCLQSLTLVQYSWSAGGAGNQSNHMKTVFTLRSSIFTLSAHFTRFLRWACISNSRGGARDNGMAVPRAPRGKADRLHGRGLGKRWIH